MRASEKPAAACGLALQFSVWGKETLFEAEKGFPSPMPPSFPKGFSLGKWDSFTMHVQPDTLMRRLPCGLSSSRGGGSGESVLGHRVGLDPQGGPHDAVGMVDVAGVEGALGVHNAGIVAVG